MSEADPRRVNSRSALRNFISTGGLGAPAPAGSSSTTINLPNGGGGSIE
jgi:hypothetical protein